MASEDPMNMFADMKKKKKKKTVVISEDVPGPEADPTYSNKEPVNDPSLGPATAHERALETTTEAAPAAAEEDDVKAMFGDVKKKKKKKEVTLDAPPEEAAPAPAADEELPEVKKKKKKKVEIPMDLGEGAAEPAPTEGDLDFSDIKKKKKKKEIPLDLDEAAPPAEGGEDFSDIKKKKKKKTYNAEEFAQSLEDGGATASSSKPKKEKAEKPPKEEDEELGSDEGDDDYNDLDDDENLGENPFAAGDTGIDAEPWLGSDRDYTYNELLNRFFRSLHAANPSLASSSAKRYTLAPPSIHREPKRSVFANIQDICRRMHRQPEHVIAFLLAELGTEGSIDGSGRLVIKGRFQQKNVENVLRRYIGEYVSCKTCKSPDTLLTKENRIYFLACESCGSKQSVSAIKTGFTAQIGRRKKAV